MGMTSVSSNSLRLHTKTDDLGQNRMMVTQTKENELDPVEFGKAMGDVKRLKVGALTSIQEKNASRIAALQELKAHTQHVRNFSHNLSNYLGVDQSIPNAFKTKIATCLNAQGDDMRSIVEVSPTKDAQAQSFILRVDQLASCDKIKSTTTFANMNTGLGLSGNLVVNGKNIPITDGSNGSLNMSLFDIGASIKNALPNVNMATFSTNGSLFSFEIQSKEMSSPINLTGTSASILQSLGIPTLLNDPHTPVVTDKDDLILKASYNGTPITRETNTLTDLVPNTSIIIKGTTLDINVEIAHDSKAVQFGLQDFVSAYNAFQDFVQQQTSQNDDHSPKEGAQLYNSTSLRAEVNSITSILSTWVSGVPSHQPKSLSEIGIVFGDQGMFAAKDLDDLLKSANQSQKLNIQDDILSQFMNSSTLSKALSVLGDYGESSHPDFSVYSVDNLLKNPSVSGQPITLSVQKVNGAVQGTFSVTIKQNDQDPGVVVNVPATLKEGGIFLGPEGSIFENMTIGCGSKTLAQLVNNGAAINTIITETKGVCSQLLDTLDVFLKNDGLLDQEIKSIEAENKRLSEEIQRIEESAKRAEERAMAQVIRTQAVIQNMEKAAASVDLYMQIISARK